jgi:hypothetical protein
MLGSVDDGMDVCIMVKTGSGSVYGLWMLCEKSIMWGV